MCVCGVCVCVRIPAHTHTHPAHKRTHAHSLLGRACARVHARERHDWEPSLAGAPRTHVEEWEVGYGKRAGAGAGAGPGDVSLAVDTRTILYNFIQFYIIIPL